MKKTFLVAVAVCIASFASWGQVDRTNFKAGLNAGIPVGDAADISSFSIGVDVAYHWGVSELLDAGLATGFINAFGDTQTTSGGGITVETEFEDFQFLPVAASVRIYPTYHFKFGADVGYAVGINDGNEGGFYYRPLIGYNITGNTEINASFLAVNSTSDNGTVLLEDNGSFAIATLGVLFLF